MTKTILLLAGLACALTVAPVPGQAQTAAQNGAESGNIVLVPDNDAAMAAAVAKARSELPGFFERLANPGAGERSFSVKFNLAPKGDAEFIWATDLRREGATLTGDIAGEPLTPGYELGQRVTIPDADIIDWAHFRGGVAVGHATTRVILDGMAAEQALPIRQALGWVD
jgi:uncharacterized protein YegJ (DUF2314 family)